MKVCGWILTRPVSAGYFLEQELDVFEKSMQLNYFGTLNILKRVIPGMVERGSGEVVVIASAMAAVGKHLSS